MAKNLKNMQDQPKRVFQLDAGDISLTKAAGILVAILALGWGIVTTIIIPLSNLGLQVTSLNSTVKMYIQTQNQLSTAQEAQITQNSNDILILKQQVATLNSQVATFIPVK